MCTKCEFWWYNHITHTAPEGQARTLINTSRPRQNARHFPGDIFKCIFMNENVWMSNTRWLKFASKGSSDNDTALVQIAYSVPSHYLNQWWLTLVTHIFVTWSQWVTVFRDQFHEWFFHRNENLVWISFCFHPRFSEVQWRGNSVADPFKLHILL